MYRFDDRVVIVTGAGSGIGRSHALLFASLGASIVVNDLGTDTSGRSEDSSIANALADEIKNAGGSAVANADSVVNGEKIVQCAMDTYGQVDVIVNNAGILRDKAFHNVTDTDWKELYEVHLLGAYKVCHEAWPYLRKAQYGRIVMTSSSSGLHGNFGQTAYASFKIALIGFAQSLSIEGRSKNIHVNTIVPLAASRLTEKVIPDDFVSSLNPEYISPLVAYLCHEKSSETGGIYESGAGRISRIRWQQSTGISLGMYTVENVVSNWNAICDFSKSHYPDSVISSYKNIIS